MKVKFQLREQLYGEMKKETVQRLKQLRLQDEFIKLNDMDLQRMNDLYDRLALADSHKLCSYSRILEKVKVIKQKIRLDTETHQAHRNSTLAAIDMVEDPTQAEIIRLRYLENWSWKEIQAKLYYSESGIRKQHDAALAAVGKHLSTCVV